MAKKVVKNQGTAVEVLVKELGFGSATKARKLIKHELVYVNGHLISRADEQILPGSQVEVVKKTTREKRRAPFEILHDDEAILVAVKAAGILAEDREGQRVKSFYKQVNDFVRETSQNKERVFLVHRLDMEVSGIMIFAKSFEVKEILENTWQENEKFYDAIVEGCPLPKEGRIESFLVQNKVGKVYATKPGPEAKQAISHYKVLKEFASFSLVEVQLETGRKNQIRVHLADLGCPIVGDRKYGSKFGSFGRIALHAKKLSIFHPLTKQLVSFNANMPNEMLSFLRQI